MRIGARFPPARVSYYHITCHSNGTGGAVNPLPAVSIENARRAACRIDDAAVQCATPALDVFGRPIRLAGKLALANASPTAVAPRQEDCRRRIIVGNGLDIVAASRSGDKSSSAVLSMRWAPIATPADGETDATGIDNYRPAPRAGAPRGAD